MKKEISKQLNGKKFFDRAFITFYYNLRKPTNNKTNSREIIASRRQVLRREQESTRVEQAKTIAKESALEVEEEDKILAKKVGK